MRFITLLFFSISFSLLSAQSTFNFSGKVLAVKSNIPIEYATISVLKNGEIIGGEITDQEGNFELKTTDNFQTVEISFIGFQTKILDRSTLTSKVPVTIFLESNATLLESVEVVGERTTTQQLIDRKIINVGADLQQSGGNGMELLDQIAEIQADLSTGEVFLRGSSNVRILINGKPSSLSPSELLAQIPSSEIDKIEIITSPSAKHQAEGISGIVNIFLKKERAKGLNLTLRGGVGTKRHNFGIDGNFNYQKLNFRASYTQSQRDMDSKEWLTRYYQDGRIEDIFAPHDYGDKVEKLAFGVDYMPNKKDEFSVGWDLTDDYHDFHNFVYYTYPTGEPDIDYLRISQHFHKTTNLNANYRHKFDEAGHFLEFDYNLNENDNRFPASDFIETTFLFDEYNANQNILHNLAFDYARPFSKTFSLEAGSAFNKKLLDSEYLLEEPSTAEVTGVFDYSEDILAFYSQIRWQVKSLTLQAGLRYEHFRSAGQGVSNIYNVNYTFSNLFPSLHFNYDFSETQKINIGLSRRLSRPNFYHINPYRQGNNYFVFIGNPQLVPEFSNNIEVNYLLNTEKINLALTGFFRHRTDVIQTITAFTEDGFQQRTHQNLGNKHSYGVETNISKQLTSFWKVTASANYYYTQLSERALVTWYKMRSSFVQIRNNFDLHHNWKVDISHTYSPKAQFAYQYILPRNRTDIAIRG
ncbi:MAG: TonB-dependent receptor, partial [Bacteroidota bacterium]